MGESKRKREVLGTLLLAILTGYKRYAHITALRGDTLAAQALGMNRVISEDAMRRVLLRIDEDSSAKWLRPALMRSVSDALDRPWILDIDATTKTVFGHQEGAPLGYNPHKPGRPSHALHTYWVGNLRLVLDVQVSSGKQHSSLYAKAGLGDSGYGNQGILLMLESRKQPYLLRLRQTKNVLRLVQRQFARSDCSPAYYQGCQMTARAGGGLIYNWWSWYCRAAHPSARMEAVTSRPLLLAAVGKAVARSRPVGNVTALYLPALCTKNYQHRSPNGAYGDG